MPEEFQFLGANLDTRTEEEKLKDFYFKEIVVSATPVNWLEKKKPEWRRFPDQNQNSSSSCVMQTIKKLAGISLWLKEKTFVKFSAIYYQFRSNKPQPGMIGVEAFEIWRKTGLTLEDLAPSDLKTEEQLDNYNIENWKKEVGGVFKIANHIGFDFPSQEFESIASVIQQTGKGVMVWFYFTSDEWSREIPVIMNQNLTKQTALLHSVAAVDYFLFNGKKYILVEDSAHFAGLTYHLISEEFFKERNFFARYPMNFAFQDPNTPGPNPIPKPQYTFTSQLKFGMEGQLSVKMLQDILKYEGLFPVNVASTGNYYAITAKAVLAWQKLHKVAPDSELDALQGRVFGPKSIAVANTIYS